jgi:hypothetical protein
MSSVIVMSNTNPLNRQSVGGKAGNPRTGGSSPIKHLIFQYYSLIAQKLNDNRWRQFFETMSRGNFWKGLKFDGVQLIAKKKTTTKTYHVVVSGEMNIQTDFEVDLEFYEGCKEFIRANSSHFVSRESDVDVEALESEAHVENGFGSSITKQGMYIDEFANRIVRENGLPVSIVNNLSSSIFSKMSTKALTPQKDFEFSSGGFIVSIRGLTVDSLGYSFDETVQAGVLKKAKTDNDEEKCRAFKCATGLNTCMKKNSRQ